MESAAIIFRNSLVILVVYEFPTHLFEKKLHLMMAHFLKQNLKTLMQQQQWAYDMEEAKKKEPDIFECI